MADHPAPTDATAPAESVMRLALRAIRSQAHNLPRSETADRIDRLVTDALGDGGLVASPPPSPGGEDVAGVQQPDTTGAEVLALLPKADWRSAADYLAAKRGVNALAAAVSRLAADNARLTRELAKCAAGDDHWTPTDGDGTVGRFLAFAACQRDDTDRAICDAFYRAFVRLEKQLDDTQRRMDAGARAFERVCFARDRFAEQLEATIARDNIEAQRIATIADEAFGPFPVQTSDENLSAIERGIFGLRQRIGNLEAQREAVADVASEGDVEDLLDALDNLSADPKDGETWGARYQTAGALHAAWQDERQRRMQAEEDAERWHRLFDEGATLMAEKDAAAADLRDRLAKCEAERDSLRAQLSAASDRYARAVAEWDEARGRLVAARDAIQKENRAHVHKIGEMYQVAGTYPDDGDEVKAVRMLLAQRDAALADLSGARAALADARREVAAYVEAHDAINEELKRPGGSNIGGSYRSYMSSLDALRAFGGKKE